MSVFEWYEDLLSKTDKSDFEVAETETFKMKIHKGENVFAEWDLTEELRDNGLAFKNYTNISENVYAEFVFIHEDLKDSVGNEESFKKIVELSLKNSIDSETTVDISPKKEFVYTFMGFGCLALAVGLVGLSIKLRGKSQNSVVKMARISCSIMCILTGIFTIIEECMKIKEFIDKKIGLVSHTVEMASIVIGSAANSCLKALLMSWKVFTVIIYVFQIVMLYRPFFFREHKKSLGKCFIRTSLVQSAAILVGFLVWTILLILWTNDNCHDIFDRSEEWNAVFLSVCCFGYIGSLILSFIFVVGYYRQNFKNFSRSKSETENMGKTMITCSIEILYNVGVLVTYMTGIVPCLTFTPFKSIEFGFVGRPDESVKCDERFRWWALDSGLSHCTIFILLCQPVIQESFFLLSELTDFLRK